MIDLVEENTAGVQASWAGRQETRRQKETNVTGGLEKKNALEITRECCSPL